MWTCGNEMESVLPFDVDGRAEVRVAKLELLNVGYCGEECMCSVSSCMLHKH